MAAPHTNPITGEDEMAEPPPDISRGMRVRASDAAMAMVRSTRAYESGSSSFKKVSTISISRGGATCVISLLTSVPARADRFQ